MEQVIWNSNESEKVIADSFSQNGHDDMSNEKMDDKEDKSEAMQKAVECCKNKEMGIDEASAIYGVSKSFLNSEIKSNNISVVDENFRVFVPSVIPPRAEIELSGFIKVLASAQVILTPVEVRRLGYELICEKYQIKDLPKEKNCILGRRWYECFTAKHLNLDDRLSIMKETPDKESAMTNFYDSLENLINFHGLDSDRIYAVDGIELKFRASTSDDSRRSKFFQKTKTLHTEAKAICSANPSGRFVPPLFLKPSECSNCDRCCSANDRISTCKPSSRRRDSKDFRNSNRKHFPTSEDLANIQKQVKNQLNKRNKASADGRTEEELREKLFEHFDKFKTQMISKKSESLFNVVTDDIFLNWFETFVNFAGSKSDKKVLLLVSDPNYLKSFKVLDVAEENGVVFLAIPPRSINKIHPLDGFAMCLNRNLSTCAKRWLLKNPDSDVRKVPFNSLFNKSYAEASNPLIAKNGFLYSGIWPVNKNVFMSAELGGESVLLQKKNSHDPLNVSSGFESQKKFSLPGIAILKDLQKFCRICMKEKMYMKTLFDVSPFLPPQPNYYGKKISDITNIPVVADDGLPESLCQLCQVKLMDVSKIKTKIIESHGKQINLMNALYRSYYGIGESLNEWNLASFFGVSILSPKLMDKIMRKTFEINSICRICMEEQPLMTSIFLKSQEDDEYSMEICGKIADVSRYQVHVQDGLSAFICPFCRTSINKTYEFVQKIIKSDKRFREIVTEMKS